MRISPINISYKPLQIKPKKISFGSDNSENFPNVVDLSSIDGKREMIDWVKYHPVYNKVEFVCDRQISPKEDKEGFVDGNFPFEYGILAETLREMQWFGAPRPPKAWYKHAHRINPKKNPDWDTYIKNLEKQALNEADKQISYLDKLKGCRYSHTFYRGVKFDLEDFSPDENMEIGKAYGEYMRNAKVGDVITPDWFSAYASTNIKTALQYSNKTILIIRTNPGAKLYTRGVAQEVVVFPPMSQFKVLSKKKQNGIETIELEYLHDKKGGK